MNIETGFPSHRERKTLLVSRPAIYTLILIAAVVTACAYRLRTNGIFSCQADGYYSNRYLAYCDSIDFGDYEHGALWFDLEPSVEHFVNKADIIFLGDSHMQFGFSTDETKQWFLSASARYYLLGFIYGENMTFEKELLRKLKPTAKVYVIPVDFFEQSETVVAKAVMHDPASRDRYEAKYLWQMIQRQACETIPAICGHHYAIFRSRDTGAYHKSGIVSGPFKDTPVKYDHDLNREKVQYYSTSGRSFLSWLPVRRDCIILTTVPTVREHSFIYSPSVETAETVAKEIGVSFVSASLEDLRTFDGSHLNESSAERWSRAFFQAAGPRILRCLNKPSNARM